MKSYRLVVISDIHGNLPVLQQVLKDASQYRPDYTFVTGDLCGGPYQDETIRILQDHQTRFILGNWEQNIFQFRSQGQKNPKRFYHQFDYLTWCSHNLSQESINVLKDRPYQEVFYLPDYDADPIRFAHGAPDNPFTLIYPETNLPEILTRIEEKVFVCGHTHSPWIFEDQEKLAINPGSLFNTIQHKSEATYGLLTWDGKQWHAELKTVPFDLKQVEDAFFSSGLLPFGGPLARAVLLSMQTGQNVSQTFVDYAVGLAKNKTPHEEYVPNAIWKEAALSFNWKHYLG